MENTRRFLPQGVLGIVLLVLLARLATPASGQGSSYQTYLPLIFSPPEPPAWVGPYGGHISAAAAHSGVVYVGTWGSGIYKSTDGGATWVPKNAGLGNRYIGALAIDPENYQIAYAGTRGNGIYKTLDGGETWFPANNGIEAYRQVYAIAIDPHDGENILAGTRSIRPDEVHPPWYGIVYRSTDQGNSWIPTLTDVGGSGQRDWAYALAISNQNPRLVYAATHEHYIYRSENFGKRWEAAGSGISDYSTRGVVVNPLSAEPYVLVYAATWIDGDIFRSNNGGDSWFFTGSAAADTHILSLSIDPGGNIIYAATFSGTGGILRTTDGGNTWQSSGLEGMDVPVVAIDAKNSNVVYGGTNGQGVFKSTDYGATWSPRQNGLHATNVSDLVVSSGNTQELFASAHDLGVQRTTDGGVTWSTLGSGIEAADILDLASPPDNPSILYALTSDAGLYRCDLDDTANACWASVRTNFPLAAYRPPALAPHYPFPTVPFPDDGLPLAPASTAGTPALQEMVFAPANPQTAYLATYGAGVYKSLDGGAHWSAAGLGGQAIVSLAVSTGDENQLYAASDTNIWHSADGGTTWEDTAFSGAEVSALALDDAGTLYAGTSNGIYRYQSGGWAHLALTGVPVIELSLHPDKPGWLYAGTRDGLRISRNGGITWQSGPAELNGLAVNAITFDPGDPRRIYLSTATQGVLRMQDD